MLTAEQNDLYTRVGPGTPCGDLMRRYWHPISTVSEMKNHYTEPVRLLGEDLVLYKDRSGTYGLVATQCAHRRMGMIYAMPDERGLRCSYHGWLYDETGQCIEQPFEDAEDPDGRFKEKVWIKAYPVEAVGGLIFAYLGPLPAPLVPRWDWLVMEDVVRGAEYTELPANWLQCQENSLDSLHVEWLHGHFANYIEEMKGALVRPGRTRTHAKVGFDVFEYGIYKRHGYADAADDHTRWADGHPIVFPNTLRQFGDGFDRERWAGNAGPGAQIRVPIDDTHTGHWRVRCYRRPEGEAPQALDDVPFKITPISMLDERGQPQWDKIDYTMPQDFSAWWTQGEIADRTQEVLGRSDTGIILFRQMLDENIKLVQDGSDPMNTFRDPTQNVYLGMRTEDSRVFNA